MSPGNITLKNSWKQAVKTAFWFALVILIAKTATAYFSSNGRTYSTFVKEVLQGDTVYKSAAGYVEQLRKADPQGSAVDWDRMTKDIAECMRSDLSNWLNSGDKRLQMNIKSEDVVPLVQQFIEPCVNKLGN